jgi:hypothetical protein
MSGPLGGGCPIQPASANCRRDVGDIHARRREITNTSLGLKASGAKLHS